MAGGGGPGGGGEPDRPEPGAGTAVNSTTRRRRPVRGAGPNRPVGPLAGSLSLPPASGPRSLRTYARGDRPPRAGGGQVVGRVEGNHHRAHGGVPDLAQARRPVAVSEEGGCRWSGRSDRRAAHTRRRHPEQAERHPSLSGRTHHAPRSLTSRAYGTGPCRGFCNRATSARGAGQGMPGPPGLREAGKARLAAKSRSAPATISRLPV